MMISASEIAKHSTKDSCWIVLHGKVWDVTDFISAHPGGEAVIAKRAGGDASEDYDMVHSPELVSETLESAACLGELDASTAGELRRSKESKTAQSQPQSKYPPLATMLSVDDFEKVARRYLSTAGWAYYASGADDSFSIAENTRVFRLLKLRPRILRDVSAVDVSASMLGHHSTLPIFISSAGLGKYAHPDAELALARAAGKEGVIQLVPMSPSMSHDAIRGAAKPGQVQFQQIYVNRDRKKAEAAVRRAENLGFKSIWVTVDSPVLGNRELDDRAKVDAGEVPSMAGVAKVASSTLLNAALNWEDLVWIRQTTKLPLVLKGIQTVEDALLAYEKGIDGIVLSNHGGRSQDTAQPPIATLLEIRRYAPHLLARTSRHRTRPFEVYLDGGIRRGTDVLKALALGCTAVGIGRPSLYAMTGGYGEEGVRRLFHILRTELEGNMAMVGARSIDELRSQMVNSTRVELEYVGGGLARL